MKQNRGAAWVGRSLCGAGIVACLVFGCSGDDDATGLASPLLDASDIVITSIEPDTATVDTTVTVRITGSGFTDGVTATWLVDTTATPEIRTVSTTWKSPSELEVHIAISPDAPLRSYSVRIRNKKGKQGIAVERFRVVAKPSALPEPEPGHTSVARDINDSGVIVGSATDASGASVALRWTPIDTGWAFTVLGQGGAIAINNDGFIVRVESDPVTRNVRSWIHLPSGAVADLGPVLVQDISDNGTLIGSIEDASRRSTAVAWKKASAERWGEPQPLPVPAGFSGAFAIDINAVGDVLGTVSSSTGSFSVVWSYRNGEWQLPTRVDDTIPSGGNAINDLGALVGWIRPCIPDLPNCYATPVRWASAGGSRTNLPTLYNSRASANGISNANQVVGEALVHYSDGTNVLAALVWHAVIWFPGSQWPEDLGAIRPSHTGRALAINNRGWVVGTMSDHVPFDQHATVWKLPASPIVGARAVGQ